MKRNELKYNTPYLQIGADSPKTTEPRFMPRPRKKDGATVATIYAFGHPIALRSKR